MNTRFASIVPALLLGTWLCSCDQGKSPTSDSLTSGNSTSGTHTTSPTDTISSLIYSPDFSVYGGTFFSTVSLELSSYTSGATIYYTTDGSAPNTGSARYTGPLQITRSCTVGAVAVMNGKQSSTSYMDYRVVDLTKTARDPNLVGTWVFKDSSTTSSSTYSYTTTITLQSNGHASLDWGVTTYDGGSPTSSSQSSEGSWYTEGSSLITDLYLDGYDGGAGTYTYRIDGTDLVLEGNRYTRK